MSINELADFIDGEISDYYSEDESSSSSLSTPQQEADEGESETFLQKRLTELKEQDQCRRLEKDAFETDSIDLAKVNRHTRCQAVEQDWEHEDCWDDSDLEIEVPLKSVELKIEMPTKVVEYSRRTKLNSYMRKNSLSTAAA